DASHGLRDHLEAVVGRVRPFGADAREGGGGDAGVDAREILKAEAEPVHRARAEVLDDDIGRLDHLLEHAAAALGLEIERHTLLVRVEEAEEHGVHVGPVAESPSGRLAPRRLDLDDFRAEPRERLGGARASFVLRQIENANALEGLARRVVLLAWRMGCHDSTWGPGPATILECSARLRDGPRSRLST